MEDLDRKAAVANQHFLALIDLSIADRYGYFLELLTNLREDISMTNDEYRGLLSEYLGNFVEVGRGPSGLNGGFMRSATDVFAAPCRSSRLLPGNAFMPCHHRAIDICHREHRCSLTGTPKISWTG